MMSKSVMKIIRSGNEIDCSMEGTSSQTDEIILSQQKDFQYECLNIVEVLRKDEVTEHVIKKIENLPKHFIDTTWTIRQMYHSFYMLYKHQANNAEQFSKQNEALSHHNDTLSSKTAVYQQELEKLTNEIADLKEERRQREMENDAKLKELNKNITFLGEGLGYTIEDISRLEARNEKLKSRKKVLSSDRCSLIRKLEREKAKNAELMDSLSLQIKTSDTETTHEQIAHEQIAVGGRRVEGRKIGERKLGDREIKYAETEDVKSTDGASSKINVFITTCKKLPNVFKSSKTKAGKDRAKKSITIKSIRKSVSRFFRSNKIAPI